MDSGVNVFFEDLIVLAIKSTATTGIALITLIALLGILGLYYQSNGEYEKAAKVTHIFESMWALSMAIGAVIGRLFKRSRKNRK